MVRETETLQQNLSDKLGLGELRVLSQGLVPVVPTPAELNTRMSCKFDVQMEVTVITWKLERW